MFENIDVASLTDTERDEWIKKINARLAEIEQIQKGELKQKNKGKVYKAFTKVGKIFSKVLLWTTVSAIVAFMALHMQAFLRQNDLSADTGDIIEFHQSIDMNTEYSNIKGMNSVSRLTVQKGKPVKFNIQIDDLSVVEKEQMQSAIDELNALFAIINPDYRFELNFDPNGLETFDPYNVDVKYFNDSELIGQDEVLGQYTSGHTIDAKNGSQGYGAEIKLRKGYITAGTFLHEALHHLGLGDAYTNYYAQVASVMQTGENHLRTNDVALLVAKYGDYSTPEKHEELVKFIASYEENQEWFQEQYAKHQELSSCLKENLPQYLGVSAEEIDFDIATSGYVYGKVEYQEGSKSYCEIVKIGGNRIQHDKYIFSSKETTQYIDDMSTSEMNGVRFVTNASENNYVFYFAYDGYIYRAEHSGKWKIEKAFEICSESEYQEVAEIEPDVVRTVLKEGMVSLDIEVERK